MKVKPDVVIMSRGYCEFYNPDMVGRTIISPTVIPVGIMTSLLGVPLLVYC